MSSASDAPGPAPHEPGSPDPSMEDILASIRRILNEEEAAPPDQGSNAHAESRADPVARNAEVLELDHSMMLPESEPAPPAPIHSSAPEPAMDTGAPMAAPTTTPQTPALVAPAAAAAAAQSVGALMRTLATERSTQVHRAGPTIEDLVREEVRPLLKEWLDAHLPPMVERLVRAEIERVVSRMT